MVNYSKITLRVVDILSSNMNMSPASHPLQAYIEFAYGKSRAGVSPAAVPSVIQPLHLLA